MSEKLLNAEIANRLPSIFLRYENVPDGLEGLTIKRIGAIKESGLVEGGLVIEYVRPNSEELRRLILAFDETSMWVAGDYPKVREH